MFGRRVALFRLSGFSVHVDLSWILVAALVTWSLASGFFPLRQPGLAPAWYWAMGLAGAAGLFASIVLHELAHAAVARRFGLPIRGITLFIFGGVAEMERDPPSPRAELLMALAGPACSAALGALLLGLDAAVAGAGLPAAIGTVLFYLGLANLVLAVFNMAPAFPLDGGRALRALLWQAQNDIRRATRVASWLGSGFGLLLMALGVASMLSGQVLPGTWWILVGLFLRDAATSAYRQVLVRESLHGRDVAHFMRRDPVTVPRSISLREFVGNFFYRTHHKMYPVVADDGALLGCLTIRSLQQVPQDDWGNQTVGSIVTPCTAENTVAPAAQALDALRQMARTGNSRLMVVDGGRLAGVVALKDLLGMVIADHRGEGLGNSRP
ncbi:MAG: site-2 protease family protein [Acidobacteria bacterium]|nr:site-2 protease family protein [Acidobacteriota bacterium]